MHALKEVASVVGCRFAHAVHQLTVCCRAHDVFALGVEVGVCHPHRHVALPRQRGHRVKLAAVSLHGIHRRCQLPP